MLNSVPEVRCWMLVCGLLSACGYLRVGIGEAPPEAINPNVTSLVQPTTNRRSGLLLLQPGRTGGRAITAEPATQPKASVIHTAHTQHEATKRAQHLQRIHTTKPAMPPLHNLTPSATTSRHHQCALPMHVRPHSGSRQTSNHNMLPPGHMSIQQQHALTAGAAPAAATHLRLLRCCCCC